MTFLLAPAPSLDSMIARSSGYIMNTWWLGRNYPAGVPTLSWTVNSSNSGQTAYNQELSVRGAAMAAFTLAVPGFCGTYNMWAPNVSSPTTARLYSARLLVALGRQHIAASSPLGNGSQVWGHSWQSPLWAAWAGLAALISWTDGIPNVSDQNNILAMLQSEADYVCGLNTDFWKDANDLPGSNTLNPNDSPTREGNSAAEELSWNATVLWVALSLMSTHPNAALWMNKAIELNICSFASKFDLAQTNISVGGLTIADWIAGRGYNIDALDLVVNHGRIHPDYMTTITQNAFGYVARSLVGLHTPAASMWNALPVWQALSLAPLDAQGTLAYSQTTPIVQFPSTTPQSDWGSRRPCPYALFDGLVTMFGPDLTQFLAQANSFTPQPSAWWASVHLADAAYMQTPSAQRPTTSSHLLGSFVNSAITPAEATYPEEETYNASQLAFLRLAQYVRYNRPNLWS